MPVPSYNVIPDNLFGTGKPVPASMLLALRNNLCALLGIDPATSNPVANIGYRGYLFFTRTGKTEFGTTATGTAPGPYSWTVPTGVGVIRIRAIAGGQNGVNGSGANSKAGGAAGEKTDQLYAVTPGETITVTVGAINGATTVTGSSPSRTIVSLAGGGGLSGTGGATGTPAPGGSGGPGFNGGQAIGNINDGPSAADYGGGGAGAGYVFGDPTRNGGSGAAGCCEITY